MHEPTQACERFHCYSHHEDEPTTGYVVCGECFHAYATAGELRRTYRRKLISLRRTTAHWPGFERQGWASTLWRAATVRARDINFCQHCLHDF